MYFVHSTCMSFISVTQFCLFWNSINEGCITALVMQVSDIMISLCNNWSLKPNLACTSLASFPGQKRRRIKEPGFSRSHMRLIILDLTTCWSVGGHQWRLQSHTVDCMMSVFTISNQCTVYQWRSLAERADESAMEPKLPLAMLLPVGSLFFSSADSMEAHTVCL